MARVIAGHFRLDKFVRSGVDPALANVTREVVQYPVRRRRWKRRTPATVNGRG